MKLSVITDEISMDFERALDVMLEYGVRSAELRSLWDMNIADLPDEQVAEAETLLKSRGMTVSCIASPFLKCDLAESDEGVAGRAHQAKDRGLDEQMVLLDRCIRLADLFNTKFIRVFSFWRRGELTEDIEAQIVQAFEEPAAVAEKGGVILGLENEHACYLGTGEEIARVIKAVNSPALRAVWDPGNALCAREVPYPNGYDAVRDFVVHVHIKDAVWEGDKPRFVRIGDGLIDYVGQFQALKAAGYRGHLSLETHFKPGGAAEEGSRQCLASLTEMLAGL